MNSTTIHLAVPEEYLPAPATPMRVLVVEDQLEHCAIIAGRLAGPGPQLFQPVFAHCAADARALLANQQFNCVLLDHYLPDGNAREILEQMEDRLLATPVVTMSSSHNPDVAMAGFRMGCVEFLPKREAFRGDVLRSTMIGAMAAFSRRAAAIARAQQRQADAASSGTAAPVLEHDELDERHHRLHEVAALEDGAYALCLAGIDGVQRPDADDGAIVRSLQACLHENDILGHWSEDTFAVLLPGAGQVRAAAVAEHLRRGVQAIDAGLEPAGHRRVSVGVAVFDAAAPQEPGAVMERAQQALHRAQARGSNRVAIAAQAADSELIEG